MKNISIWCILDGEKTWKEKEQRQEDNTGSVVRKYLEFVF